jgi:hypothetical protein
MNVTSLFRFVLVAATVTLCGSSAFAGPYGDSLAKCLVSSTTSSQKRLLVRWIFATVGVHPEVRELVVVSPALRDELDKGVAKVFETLLTESCVDETREALRYEGEATMHTSFAVLGQVAMRELIENAEVDKAMTGMARHLDAERIESALKPQER